MKPKKDWSSILTVIFLVITVLALVFTIVCISSAEDSKEVLTLKRDLAQERVARLNAQLSLMQQQFNEGQNYLKEVTKELNDLNAKLTAMEPKKEELKKPEVKKEEKPKVEEKKK